MNKTKLLIVEDNKHYLELLIEFLSENGYEVESSMNGKDAKAKFLEYKPDIVLTDVVMPDADGIELLIELRKMNADSRVIVMSGGNRGYADSYLQMADALGANAILNKPFELPDLLVEIKKIETSI